MMLAEQLYLEEIQMTLCPKCVDGDGTGDCRISRGTECAVKRFFPQILEAVRSTYSTSMELYELALREKVCRVCANQSADGTCILRNELECSLDRYFPLIVRVIEELDLKQQFSNVATKWR